MKRERNRLSEQEYHILHLFFSHFILGHDDGDILIQPRHLIHHRLLSTERRLQDPRVTIEGSVGFHAEAEEEEEEEVAPQYEEEDPHPRADSPWPEGIFGGSDDEEDDAEAREDRGPPYDWHEILALPRPSPPAPDSPIHQLHIFDPPSQEEISRALEVGPTEFDLDDPYWQSEFPAPDESATSPEESVDAFFEESASVGVQTDLYAAHTTEDVQVLTADLDDTFWTDNSQLYAEREFLNEY